MAYRIRHTVQRGDTIPALIDKHQITWSALMLWNPSKKPPNDRLYITDVLNMSSASETLLEPMQWQFRIIDCPLCQLEKV